MKKAVFLLTLGLCACAGNILHYVKSAQETVSPTSAGVGLKFCQKACRLCKV